MKVLRPMLPFLKTTNHFATEEPVDENRLLLEEFAALDVQRRDEVADRLAVLWHCFVEAFGSPAEFNRQPRAAQDTYIAKFERVATRSQHVRRAENGHLHYSVALMLHFLRIARDGARQQSALDVSGHVATLINRARERQLASTRTFLADALSTSDLGPPAVDTEVIVDCSTEYHDHLDDASVPPPPPIDTEVIVDRSTELQEQSEASNADGSREQRPVRGDGGASHRTRAIYMRAGERWVKRPRTVSARHVG
jgi:hypothetical protein